MFDAPQELAGDNVRAGEPERAVPGAGMTEGSSEQPPTPHGDGAPLLAALAPCRAGRSVVSDGVGDHGRLPPGDDGADRTQGPCFDTKRLFKLYLWVPPPCPPIPMPNHPT